MFALMTRFLPGRSKVTPRPSPGYMMIENEADLRRFAEQLEKESAIAVDMEADSMYHFRERVCLIQIATPRFNAVVDPLKIPDMSCLAPLFADPGIQKIFHGADYDIRSLYRDFRIVVTNLFDTQIAARFLGYKETGLEAVLSHQFEVALDKRYQKKDWSQRPLPLEMLEYASRDTIYLLPLAKLFQKELKKKRRLEWVMEECEELSKVRSPLSDETPLFLRFKGAGRFRPRGLAILEAILHLRQNVAQQKDRPPFKVINNDSIIKIVENRPVSLQELRDLHVLSEKQMGMFGREIVASVQEALERPRQDLPTYPRTKSPITSPRVPERIQALKDWRDQEARRLDIDPALVCNKSLMTNIARENPSSPAALDRVEELRVWQRKTFGDAILSVLHEIRAARSR